MGAWRGNKPLAVFQESNHVTFIVVFGSWLPVLGLICLAFGAVTAFANEDSRPRSVLARAMNVSLLMVGLALVNLVRVSIEGPWSLHLGTVLWSPLDLRFDLLSTAMLVLVSLIGAVSVRFSLSYLDGDARQSLFVARMLATLLAVCLLVTAGSFLMLWLAWVALSITLQSLLLFHAGRVQARAAARKKFWISRVSDVALGAALLLIAYVGGTSELAALEAGAEAGRYASPLMLPAMILIAVAAMLQSVQLPSHNWLTEVMETPTPVSALLHAGIVNAGGFLLLRFSDILVLVPEAMTLLVLIGGLTALMGSLIMLFQTSIKVSLAWSTIAQMGFMVLQVGLGAFSAAALHIVAHSFYKAHAFLSSGSVIDNARLMALAGRTPVLDPALRASLLMLTAALVSTVVMVYGNGAGLVLGLVAVLGVVQFIMDEAGEYAAPTLFLKLGVTALVGAGLYIVLHGFVAATLGQTFADPDAHAVLSVLDLLFATLFLALAVLRGWLVHPRFAGSFRSLRIHLANGLYGGLLTDVLVGRYRAAKRS